VRVLKIRIIILGFILAAAAGVGLLLGVNLTQLNVPPASPPTILNTATLVQQIESLAELVTVKYVLEKLVVLEDTRWYGDNRVLLVAHGIVKAGIDLRSIAPSDLDLDRNILQITLPPVSITDVYLDEQKTRVLEHSTGLLRAFNKNLEAEARRQAVDELKHAARQGGIYEDAQLQARQQLTNLFGRLHLEVRFR
jgi:hypothetical protein